MHSNYNAEPVYRMIIIRLIDAISTQDWEKVKALKTELERISE